MPGSSFDGLSFEIGELIFEEILWDGLLSFRGVHSNAPFGLDCPAYIKTLTSCRLVDRAFNAFPQLFHTIQLTRPGSYVCNMGGDLAARRAQQLLVLMERNPAICHSVQSLGIHSTGENQSTRIWFKNDPSIKQMLPKLTNVKHFSINLSGGNLSWTKLSKSMSQAFEKFCLSSSITRLDFQKILHLPLTTCILRSKTLTYIRLYGVEHDQVGTMLTNAADAAQIKTLRMCTHSMTKVLMAMEKPVDSREVGGCSW